MSGGTGWRTRDNVPGWLELLVFAVCAMVASGYGCFGWRSRP